MIIYSVVVVYKILMNIVLTYNLSGTKLVKSIKIRNGFKILKLDLGAALKSKTMVKFASGTYFNSDRAYLSRDANSMPEFSHR